MVNLIFFQLAGAIAARNNNKGGGGGGGAANARRNRKKGRGNEEEDYDGGKLIENLLSLHLHLINPNRFLFPIFRPLRL